MKKLSILCLILFVLSNANAKRVKFAVDMRGVPINATGMHISGDFQTAAGYIGGDWCSDCTPLTIEAQDSIYSIVVDIPAFAKYEYKFLNGDQFYDAEFVPVESRIGYNFNDSRWIYVDSLADDTTFVGAIRFAANAPANKFLVRLRVNMNSLPVIDPFGVHVAGDFQAWNTENDILYSFVPGVWEKICYLDAGTYEYRFFNGTDVNSTETVPSLCAVNGSRQIIVTADTIPSTVCFSECAVCNVGIAELSGFKSLSVSPNPMSEFSVIRSEEALLQTIEINDISGRVCLKNSDVNNTEFRFDRNALPAGMYLVKATDISDNIYMNKLIIE